VTAVDAIGLLAQYGGWAVLVFVTIGFVWGIVLPRSTHTAIVNIYLSTISERDKRIVELQRDNDRLWTIATSSSSQAARALEQAEQPWPPPPPRRPRLTLPAKD
jgi:hypothetical protein